MSRATVRQPLPSQPLYGQAFQCVSGACDDTCCNGFSVPVDKKTYEFYRLLPVSEIRSAVDTHIRKVPGSTSDNLYASIEMTADKKCPFFTAQRLCGIHKEHGHDYLSAACSTYPRALNQVDGRLEVSLYLSCPEAARMVLLDPGFANHHTDGPAVPFRTDQFSKVARNGPGLPHKPFNFFTEVRLCLGDLITDRSRPLWQRIFLMGMMCKQLDEVTSLEGEAKVAEIIQSYQQIVEEGTLRTELDHLPANTAAQLDLVLRVADLANRSGVNSKRFNESFQDFLAGIGYAPESSAAQDLERYQHADNAYCKPFLEQHPHILENYLLNYIFRTLFPFGREASAHSTPKTIFQEYTLLIGQYVLVHGLLIGISGNRQSGFDEKAVVKTVQSFSKTVEHSPGYLQQLLTLLEDRNLADMKSIAEILPR
ncbi:flagellin lysine-N-methylase [Terriglobus albidus]|uniref:flagellin lysine-N-methylase n=1 Tax=Terriglobus albidus TaxID=1592106 RepID=UPI0021DFEED9|nr:flagellin lysine-N-methylase [Terriglobus albidus]